MKSVRILGTHGIPAAYGGFETAAEKLSLYLVKRGWRVIVYCQTNETGPIREDEWNGIIRVTIPVPYEGWRGTAVFDWLSIAHASKLGGICLTFGYNTGLLNWRLKRRRIPNLINMDGIEWQRKRWGYSKRFILYVNERFAAAFGTHLIADHPEIQKFLISRVNSSKITMIAYGADPVNSPPFPDSLLSLGLEPRRYLTLIARPIPENSILELVKGFSEKRRGVKLAVFGVYGSANSYHQAVIKAASPEVVFPGAIYGSEVPALRYYGLAYLHGHTVGGTNPSLVEAMAAGNPVIAHNNPYNRWVAQDAALYFDTIEDVSELVDKLIHDPDLCQNMRGVGLKRFSSHFTWDRIGAEYEALLDRFS